MPSSILDGFALVDSTGRFILATILVSLLAAIVAHVFLRLRYAALEKELEPNAEARANFSHPVLTRIVRDSEEAARRTGELNLQAIIEDNFQLELKPLLLAERFVRAATGLVLVLGLLGTFYGLTLSIGRLVQLVTGDPGTVTDVTQSVTQGLTQALAGMAVAFSNSLVGIGAAVVLTVMGIVSNATDRRTGLMIRIETYLDRLLSDTVAARDERMPMAGFDKAVARLEATVARFDTALRQFAANTKDLREVQLVVTLKPGDGR